MKLFLDLRLFYRCVIDLRVLFKQKYGWENVYLIKLDYLSLCLHIAKQL